MPWRNFRRVALLIIALMSVVALKRSAGGFFKAIVDSVSPPTAHAPAPSSSSSPAAAPAPDRTVHMRSGSFAR